MPTSSVDGLVSGLNTGELIAGLMQIERQPQQRLQAKRDAVNQAVAAYQAINAKFAGLKTAAASLATAASWQAYKATSSDPDAVTATATAGANAGSLSFTVTKLAAAGAVVSSGTASSTSAVVAGSTISVTKGTTTTSVNVGDGSLASVVKAVNAAGLGVSAVAVQTSPGAFRLQMTSTTTGADSALSVDLGSSALGTMTTLTAAGDAELSIGTGPGAYVVRSATNTVSDVIPGVTFSLLATTTAPVTVGVERDGEALADKLAKVVEAANAALGEIKAKSGYDAATKTGGVLLGDGAARRLEQQVLQTVSTALGTGTMSLGTAGVSLTREGTLAFDKAAFATAYAKDPDGVSTLFRQGGTTSNAAVTFLSAGDATRAGTYEVKVTTPAAQASATSSTLGPSKVLLSETISLRVGTKTATYAAPGNSDLATVAAGLNAAIASAGLDLSARVENGALVVRSSGYGTAATFDVMTSRTGVGQTNLAGLTANTWVTKKGVDVAGTINGVAATGSGQVLRAPSSDPVLAGLALNVTATAPLTATFGYGPGLAQRLATVANDAVDAVSGSLTLAVKGRQSETRSLDQQIANWDVRLATRQQTLQRQFSALEVALGRMRQQSGWLSGQLASLGGS